MHYRPIDALHGCWSCCSAPAALLLLLCWCCWLLLLLAVVEVEVVVMGCGTSHGARAGSLEARTVIRSASASNPVFQLEVTPCLVVCPLCFAFHKHNFCEQRWWHWLSVRNVSCKSSMLKWHHVCGVPIVFCSGRVDFTQVGWLHAEWVCPCGGLTSRGLGWLNPGAKYPWWQLQVWIW